MTTQFGLRIVYVKWSNRNIGGKEGLGKTKKGFTIRKRRMDLLCCQLGSAGGEPLSHRVVWSVMP